MAGPSKAIADLVVENPRRPILTHLNADTSWLLSFPVPPSLQQSKSGRGRAYFHVLLDPWLTGDIVVGHRWFMVLMHSVEAKFTCIQDINNLILEIEKHANNNSNHDEGDKGNVDVVVVSHYLTDHCHRETLTAVDPAVPVVSVDVGVQDMAAWKHFETIEQMPDLDLDFTQGLWREEATVPSLPNWLRVGRLPSGERMPALHFATLFAYDASGRGFGPEAIADKNGSVTVAETILYTPHGIYADRLPNLATEIDTTQGQEKTTNTDSKMLAVLHGLDPAYYPWPIQANLGVENGHKLALRTGSKYWIPTHDEHLTYTGLNGYLQQKFKRAFDDVISLASSAISGGQKDDSGAHNGLICKELGNGESFLLV